MAKQATVAVRITPQLISKGIEALRETYGLDYTVGHVVFSDLNINHDSIYLCMEPDNFRVWLNEVQNSNDMFDWQQHYINTSAAVQVLTKLLEFDDEFLSEVANAIRKIRTNG